MNQNFRHSLTLFLCVTIFLVWMMWFAPKPAPQIQSASTQNPPVTETTPTEINSATLKIEASPLSLNETQATPQVLNLKNSKIELSISTEGGQVVGASLLDYHTTVDDQSPHKDLLTETHDSRALFLGFENLGSFTEKKVFEVVEQTPSKIVLRWQNQKIQIDKIFSFIDQSSNYALNVEYQVKNLSNENLDFTPYWSTQVTQKKLATRTGILGFLSKSSTQAENFVPSYLKNKTLINGHWQDLKTISDEAQWAGISDRYFLMAIASLPEALEPLKTEYTRDGEILKLKVKNSSQSLAPQASVQGRVVSYFGPKQTSELQLLNVHLDRAVDYGWFALITIPILWLMQTLHSLIPNWGVSIILLTFIVKILLHPVNKKSMTSMKGMQQLQPKLEEIRKKYPEDKMKQNEEVMQLFRAHGVNPLGGCLPMLMQLPIYIALYRVLWNAIELYHSPFLHYKDLSAPDPYFVAPIVLGVFMFFQQKLTPNPSTDPAQKKMMMFMPILFTGFMLFLPVGLVIYICINTSMSVIQQYMMRKDISFRDLILRRQKASN